MSRIQTTLSGFSASVDQEQSLAVNVAFTSEQATAGALRYAAELAGGLGARLRVLIPEVVPYGRDLDDPTVSEHFMADRALKIERETGVAADVQIVLCRDRAEGLHDALGADGLVVIGGARRWWQFSEKQLVRRLAELGHKIVFVEGDRSL